MPQPTKGLLGSVPPAPTAPTTPANGTVTEKDKSDFQQFIAQGVKLLHAPETRGGMIDRLRKGNPIQAIAEVTLAIVQKLEQVAEVSDIVKLDGANVLMKEVSELATAAGVKELTDEEKSLAFSLAMEMYVMQGMKSGKLKPEDMQAVVQQQGGQTQGMVEQQGPNGAMTRQGIARQGMMGGQNGPA